MARKHSSIIDETVKLLLEKLKDKIANGTATAAEQANFIKLVQESGYAWHDDVAADDGKPKAELPSFDDDEDDQPIPFKQAR